MKTTNRVSDALVVGLDPAVGVDVVVSLDAVIHQNASRGASSRCIRFIMQQPTLTVVALTVVVLTVGIK